jgi:DNA polymerase-3 subunit epsilon
MAGYAVIDVETTGLFPGKHDRIAEVGVVVLDASGEAIATYDTLVNPGRDLGPQAIHGLSAADIRLAPTFEQVAGDIIAHLQGRVVAGHNISFDLLFLRAEFERIGLPFPLQPRECLCTMMLAQRYLDAANRTLQRCCEAAGVTHLDAHSALGDATATSQLLATYIRCAGVPPPWTDLVAAMERATWPAVQRSGCSPMSRASAATTRRKRGHFLSRIAASCEAVGDAAIDSYLAVLDKVLLDRLVSDTEADQIVELAMQFSLSQDAIRMANQRYLECLARAAWADGVVTEEERGDLESVAALLGLPSSAVSEAVRAAAPGPNTEPLPGELTRFELRPGDIVVLTGEMKLPRFEWELRITAAGLLCGDGITKKTKLLVAADPDSLSGKAHKANTYGIPIVTENAFEQLLRHVTQASS